MKNAQRWDENRRRKQALAHIHERIANRRSDFAHKVLVNPRDTSKLCSSCGKLVQKALSDRIHTCPRCGLVLGRDHNAARNILHRGLQTLRL